MKPSSHFFRWMVSGAPVIILCMFLLVTSCTIYIALKLPMPELEDAAKGNEARGTKIQGGMISLSNLLNQVEVTPTPVVDERLDVTSEQLLAVLGLQDDDGCMLGASYQCYEDENARALGRPFILVNTLTACRTYCTDLNMIVGRQLFMYAGARARADGGNVECFCDFRLPTTPQTQCNYPCEGDPNEMCGGFRGNISMAIAVTSLEEDLTMCESEPAPSVSFPECDTLTTEDKFGITFTSSEEESLYTAKALKAMCAFADEFINIDLVNQSCTVHTLGHHVGLLVQKQCHRLKNSHLQDVLTLLTKCAPFLHSESFSTRCFSGECPDIPPECIASPSVYVILGFLVDVDFISSSDQFLTYSQMFVSLKDADDAVEFYHRMREVDYDVTKLEMVGADPSIVRGLLKEYISVDTVYFAVAMLLILAMTFLYTHSISITIGLLLDVIFSLLLGYFFYFVIFDQTFFPFLNMTVALLVIGLAADDIFLFYDIWLKEKESDPTAELWDILGRTFKHAALSIFVTSFTTALALYSNFYSSVTFVKNLALFSGTTIICQFFVIITLIPAVIIVEEKIKDKCKSCNCLPECCSTLQGKIHAIYNRFYDVTLPAVINKGYPLWLLLSLLVAAGGFVIVFYKPTLKIPELNQLLSSGEFAEYYDLHLRDHFYFETLYAFVGLPLSVVWGVIPEDNGDFTNPDDRGMLIYDDTFDLSSRDAQTYMTSFCQDLKHQNFVIDRVKDFQCTFDLFNAFMLSPCLSNQQSPCCGQQSPPFSPQKFRKCFPKFTLLLRESVNPNMLIDWPYFDGDKVVALKMTVESTEAGTLNFPPMDALYKVITDFIESKNAEAPEGVDQAFITAYFRFYDLQSALIYQTYPTVGISLAIAFAFVLLITRNIITSLYSMLTVTLIIFVMIAFLVLLGWNLNVLESVTISMAAGLAIDFVIHYSIAFTLSSEQTRAGCVKESLSRVGSSVAMAALTSFLAGVPLLNARVQGFKQFGVFLMVIMFISWIYSTFFFQSLCRFIGPLRKTGELIPVINCRACSEDKESEEGSVGKDLTLNLSPAVRAKLEPMSHENKAFDPR